jgi:hypothetical protein
MHWIESLSFQRLQNAVLAVCCARFPKEYCWFDSPQSPFQCLQTAVAFGLSQPALDTVMDYADAYPLQRQLNCWGTLLLDSGALLKEGSTLKTPFKAPRRRLWRHPQLINLL